MKVSLIGVRTIVGAVESALGARTSDVKAMSETANRRFMIVLPCSPGSEGDLLTLVAYGSRA